MFPKKSKKQPVLKVRRRAGQSIRDEKERLTDNRLIPFYFGTAFLWMVWALEEVRARTHQPPVPQLALCLAIIATGVSVIIFGRLWRKYRNLNRGERGELHVAEILDDLRSIGYHAFHDLVGDGYNIDHVVVGPAGVFAIETKFRSGDGVIEYRNGEGLFLSGRKIDEEERDPLKQARGSARSVRKQLKEHAGRNIWTKAVLVYVGDWRIKDDWTDTDVSVLATGDLSNYFNRYQPELLRHEIELICTHLERSVKS
jgi:hypothetical protein